jgi:D-sedoheptulose 7-phosphate isomerase
MKHLEYIKNQFHESAEVKTLMAEKLSEEVDKIAVQVVEALKNGKKMFWCGNGGSAADSQHLSTELISRLRFNRPAIPSIALTTDTSFLTAHTNDFDFDDIFSRQIEALGQPGDVLVGISTSGNSGNIIKAIRTAKSKELLTIAFSGKDGGTMKSLADFSLIVPSNETQRIQEGHITIGHILCDLIEKSLYGKNN